MNNIEEKLICSICGSSNVQERAWVDANTREYCSSIDDGDIVWCDDCQTENAPKVIHKYINPVLKFYSPTCGPCKALQRVIDGYYKGNDDYEKIQNIDVTKEENLELVNKYKISSLPTLLMIDKEGKEIKRVNGVLNEDKLIEFCNFY